MAEARGVVVRPRRGARPVEEGGWRSGRPVEDPEKTKRWGFVTAKPSEYLVHVRRGRVLGRSSGQGASCFKWPRDSVAVVPTSLQRMHFTADQVTLEKVGVEVEGLAVYRIADPLVAYRVLNFSYPERAQEKLEQTLVSMLVGATRRLVANLTVDECFRKRKAALADELLEEIAPVLGGAGRPDDATDRGWGVVLDTIEIQEVRVLSESVFASMQAPFRAQLDREAREARADADRRGTLRETEAGREIEAARLEAEAGLRERRLGIARAQAEAQAEAEREEARRRAALAVEKERLAAEQARAEVEAFEARSTALARQADLERARWAVELERRSAEAEVDARARTLLSEAALAEARVRGAAAMAEARARSESAEAEARLSMAEHLPELAAAVGARFGEVKVTQIGGEGSAFGSIAQAVSAVLELVRQG